MILRTSLFLALCVVGTGLLPAQPAAVQQLQNTRLLQQIKASDLTLAAGTNAPDLFVGEQEDVGPQRILRVKPRHTWFDVVLDTQFFYSDNANFDVAARAIGSGVYVNTAQAALNTPAAKIGAGDLSGTLGFSSQWYNYDQTRLQPLDFNAHIVFLNGKYVLQNWQFGLGLNATRLLNQSDNAETYRELMPNFGIQYTIPLHDRVFLSFGDLVEYHLTEVPVQPGTRADVNDRLDNIASVTLTWMVTSHFVVQPYYRFLYSHYEHDTLGNTDRTDHVHSFGIMAAYYFNDHLSLRTFFNYNHKQSDDRFTPDYRELNGGGGLSLDWKF